MSIELAQTLVTALGVYTAIGAVMGLLVVTIGAAKIDPGAKGMPLQARAIIFPGTIALWPLMLAKLFTQSEPPAS